MKLSAAEARAALLLKIKQDGKKCFKCKRVPVAKVKDPAKQVHRLVLHHVDDNNENNPADGSNWKAACDSCNCILRKPYDRRNGFKFKKDWHLVLTSTYTRRSLTRTPPQMLTARKASPFFRQYVKAITEKLGEVEEEQLLLAASNEFFSKFGEEVSQQTLGSYLDRLCNSINGEYERFQKDEDWWVRRRQP